jgi:hypothetical protein
MFEDDHPGDSANLNSYQVRDGTFDPRSDRPRAYFSLNERGTISKL